MALIATQPLALLLSTPTFSAVSASDTFAASQGQAFILYYINGGTATTAASYVSEKVAIQPFGSVPVVPATPATKWSDGLLIATTFPATTSRWCVINPVDNYLSGGLVTLLHGGTLTTLTIAIGGPF
jgi:hypothetical protein